MKVVVELDIHTVSLLGRSLEEFLQNLLPLLTTPDVCLWSNEISDLSAFFSLFRLHAREHFYEITAMFISR